MNKSKSEEHISPGYVPKSKITALLLCLFWGGFGIHRFYRGKYISGVLMLLTFGGLGIWTLVDFILLCCKKEV